MPPKLYLGYLFLLANFWKYNQFWNAQGQMSYWEKKKVYFKDCFIKRNQSIAQNLFLPSLSTLLNISVTSNVQIVCIFGHILASPVETVFSIISKSSFNFVILRF